MTTLSSEEASAEGDMDIPELQRDLQRNYKNVGRKVEEIWRNFTPKQREKAMRESTGDGKVLRNSRDPGLDRLKDFLPDWNLEDITSTPEFFLDRLKFRAETDLLMQHFEGANDGPGDQEVVRPAVQRTRPDPDGILTVFVGDNYGRHMEPNGAEGRRRIENTMAARSRLIVPCHEGQFIIARQMNTLIFYNALIEEILDLGSTTRVTKPSSGKKASKETANALANLTIQPKPLKASISDVIAQAVEQKVGLEDYLGLLRSEPLVLAAAVNKTYSSRPELVPDDRGRILPLFLDKYISTAFLEVMSDAIKLIVTWDYITRLVRMLDGLDDKVKRPLVMQELSNTCHLEYRRAQTEFRRQMSMRPGFAGSRLKRVIVGESSRIAIKGQPSDVTVSDPQLHYVLRLCSPETSHKDAVQWIQKLDEHNSRHPDDRDRIHEHQVMALGDLAIIVSFMHTLSSSLTMVPGSKKTGLLFTGRTAELDAELNQYKAKADFGDYVVPMDNLLEPGMAGNALQALNDFVIDQAGTSLGSLYDDMLQECLADIEKKYTDIKTRQKKTASKTSVPLSTEALQSASFRTEQRREKAKTRPSAETGAHDITAVAPPPPEQAIPAPSPRLQVKSSTATVFDAIFTKSEARSSVSWADFAAAMTDLGFSVTPKGGSVYTFHPSSDGMADRGSLTLHRPHGSEIEGWKLLFFAKRLRRTYGWEKGTFEAV